MSMNSHVKHIVRILNDYAGTENARWPLTNNGWSYKELKATCKALGLKTQGKKSDLIDRLVSATPTAEQMQAVKDYAETVGEGWKDSLLVDWRRSGTQVWALRDRYHLLQQVRNTLGPKWLVLLDF